MFVLPATVSPATVSPVSPAAARPVELRRNPLVLARTLPPAALATLRRIRQRCGLPLFCVDAETGQVVGGSAATVVGTPPPLVPQSIRPLLATLSVATVFAPAAGLLCYAVPLQNIGGQRLIGLGYQLSDRGKLPTQVTMAAAAAGWTSGRLTRWVAEHPACSAGPLGALLNLALKEVQSERTASAAQAQLDQLGEQLDQTFEEISLLHALTRNLQISRGPADLARLCLDRMPELIDAAGHAIALSPPGERPQFHRSGELPFDAAGLTRLMGEFESHDWSRPLVLNFVDRGPLAAAWSGLQNLVAVPVAEGRHRYGWIVSVNLAGDREFGTVEASLLSSIATILGTHVRNIDLYREHNDLLFSFVRSLVSTLDAKDPYTRGHSERVALIGRRLGAELGLPEEELKTIHLSGLLHDIGKIGVNESILRKNGPLNDDEFQQIQRHPMIGFNILSGLKNLRHVLPGVRSHHENVDGSGYPDQLAGDDIPLLARILAVADGYDAMGSDRPYRKGMPIEKIEAIFSRGSGRQWDSAVIDAYFRCRTDVLQICGDYSLEQGAPLETVSLS